MPNIGPLELFLILAVIVLLFGAAKLPELARGTGRALRIFKTETKGLLDEDSKDAKDPVKDSERHPADREIEARNAAAREADLSDAEVVAERDKRDTV